jgi:ferredoxin-NADP reductase/fatty acid desaturase
MQDAIQITKHVDAAIDHEAYQYESMWQRSIPQVAWGTLLLFFGIITGYTLVISGALAGIIPYPVAILVCGYFAFASFTVLHDAGHGSIFKMGSRFKRLEVLIGWAASIPMLVAPFRLFQKIHDRHHAFTNDPERDPDYFGDNKHILTVLAHSYYIPFKYHVLSATKLKHLKIFRDTYPSTIVYFSFMLGGLLTLVLNGFALEILCFAILPNLIAILLLVMFFDYIPHQPNSSLARYQNTRIFTGGLWNALLFGQNYHLIHHLYPRLPWYKYQEVFNRILPDLERKQAPIEQISAKDFPGFLKSENAVRIPSNGEPIHMVLPVSDIERLTDESVAISLKLPEQNNGKNGVTRFRAGQYITISKWLNGEQHMRCYSLCASPENGTLKIGVKATPNGLVSNYLNTELTLGDKLIVQGPFGDFTFPVEHDHQVSKLILIAGGSGITPQLAILEHALIQKKIEHVHLIYVNRSESSTMFMHYLEELQAQHSKRFDITFVLEKPISQELVFEKNQVPESPNKLPRKCSGRFDKNMLESLVSMNAINQEKTDVYICGPAGLKDMVFDAFRTKLLLAERIHVEEFVATATPAKGRLNSVQVSLLNGQKHLLKVASNQTVLEVAKAEGIAIPHACGNGSCGTCKMKVETGNVASIASSIPGLLAEEKKNGFTLACQCRPMTDICLSENLN